MGVKSNLEQLRAELAEEVTLVAVSKTKPIELLQEAYDAGQRIFGENRPQEMKAKSEQLPKDIQWHMIGHLQSNKVKYIAHFVDTIHSVDKLGILQEIDKRAKQQDRVIKVLLQVYIAKEESKFGMDKDEVIELLESREFETLKNIQVLGLMGMATFTDSSQVVRNEFKELKKIFDNLKESHFPSDENFKEISMGMSGDYGIAIEAGSTMVRVGSKIFGNR